MHFGNNEYLYFFLIIIPLIAFLMWSYKKKEQLIKVFLGKPLTSRLL
ncbi:uncharacterized protein METZ01_LOCUS251825, partial [marine metagenome]